MPPVADRIAGIAPFHVMELLGRARTLEAAGRSIVHMEIGEPDFATPQPVIEAGQRALAQGLTGYTPALGLPALREAIAGFYQTRYGIAIDPARVVVTPGASGALLLALGAVLNPGDELLLADPGYPCNRHFARVLGGEPRLVPVGPETHFQITAAHIAEQWGARSSALLVASPSNPTGTVLERSELAALATAVGERGGELIVDEIYHGLVYGGALESVLSVSNDAFVINSFSKYFCMTGWRLGWLIVPEAFIRPVEKLAQNLFIAPSTPAQYAALAAFEPATLAELERRRAAFQERRDYLLPALEALGFTFPSSPRGAFYLYADCSRHSADSMALASALLEQAGVAVTPGLDFGEHRPERHLRFAYTTDLDSLQDGVARIAQFLASQRQ